MLEKVRLFFDRTVTAANLQDRLVEIYGDRTSVILEEELGYTNFPGRSFTYTQGAEFVNRIANVLKNDLKIKKGDRVGICTMNNADLFLIIVAVMKAGGIAVPMNFMLRGREIRYIIENCSAKMMIVDRDVFNSNIREKSRLPSVKKWIMAGPRKDVPDGFFSLDGMMSSAGITFTPVTTKPREPVAIFYTSGTTGFPKGAVMSSEGIIKAQKRAAAVLPIGKKDFGIMSLPLAHIMGFAVSLLGLCAGAPGYFMKVFNPQKVLEVIERYRATLFVGVPAMYSMMLNYNPEKYDLSSVKMWASAADAMPSEHIKRYRRMGSLVKMGPLRLPSLFTEAYGMVELAGLCTLKLAVPGFEYPPGCVGFPMPPAKVRIVDEEGNEVPRGEVGELAVKSPGVMLEYWNNPEETGRSFTDDRWFRTGDMAKKGRLGMVYFVDRKKDVIKCGGYSVFSVEVEEEILVHKKVAEAAVLGMPHPTKGEVPIAIITLKQGEKTDTDEILAWCKENIAPYKAPRDIKIVAPADLPHGMTLKVLKRVLRDKYKEEYKEKFA